MTDQPSPTESDSQIERRIDEVISHAAELAQDLKDEVGDPEPSGMRRDQKFFETQAASENAPEMQLAQADAAIAHAAREIGAESPPPKATKISLPPRGAKAAGPTQAATPPLPEPSGTLSVGALSVESSAQANPADSAAATADAPAVDGEPADPPKAPEPTPTASAPEATSPILERTVGFLEAIDRPVAGINADIRWVLGWVALVFLVGAASLFFFVIL